jgi:hypothetical protein
VATPEDACVAEQAIGDLRKAASGLAAMISGAHLDLRPHSEFGKR